MPIHPISFSIHESKVVTNLPVKTRLCAFIEPGNLKTYVYQDEASYYGDYQSSYFALTKKKSGWDCMRHYEILANGCLPVFADLERAPANTMTHLPKQALLRAKQLYSEFQKGISESLLTEYQTLQQQLLLHTQQHLTNKAMATYVLKTVDQKASSVLFLSGKTSPDYMRCTLVVGFKQLLGSACHDYPRIPHLYTDYPLEQVGKLYGKGFTYSRLLEPSERESERDETIEKDIAEHRYDLVIYGSYHRGMPLLQLVRNHYAPEEIVLICGEDAHRCNAKQMTQNHVFVRELS